MQLELKGVHHVTAVTADAARNLDFYTRVLGLRLVKKTVNQDDVSAYHLFYGDENGSAGTEMTFFDWSSAAPNGAGTGEVSTTCFRVPNRAALDWWLHHFEAQNVMHSGISSAGNRVVLGFTDPEGQRLRLVEDDAKSASGTPWRDSPIPAEVAIRGLGPVVLTLSSLEPTATLLTQILGFRRTNEYSIGAEKVPEAIAYGAIADVEITSAEALNEARVYVFETGDGGAGAEVHLDVQPNLPRARSGRGGVHHVAFRAPDDFEHEAWQHKLAQAGLGVTPVIDRFYFKSIYFREPGGVLFEIATDGPGFATDEDAAHLGEKLSLPPFLEAHRAQIEAGLRPIWT